MIYVLNQTANAFKFLYFIELYLGLVISPNPIFTEYWIFIETYAHYT